MYCYSAWLIQTQGGEKASFELAAFGFRAAVGPASSPSAALAVLGTDPDTATDDGV
jgi:hypothetical protein